MAKSRWRRRIEANVDLTLNYCRAIAAMHITQEQRDDIEAAHTKRMQEIDDDTSPEPLDDGDDEDD
jgi:hypothetical protein